MLKMIPSLAHCADLSGEEDKGGPRTPHLRGEDLADDYLKMTGSGLLTG